MKKNRLSIFASLLFLSSLLVGCNQGGQQSDSNSAEEESTSYSVPSGTPTDQTYYFFLDYSHSDSDNPFKKVKWWRNVPLGSVPEGCALTSKNAADPLFPVFLGWSEYSSSIDDSKLWDFSKDYKTTQVVFLYGIWVAND